jgi:UDP-N-acetylglucosamine 4-epimerase
VFSLNYGLESIGLRYFNVFGVRQDPQGPYAAVIPQWVDAMLKHQPVHINGDGSTSRDFCYVANTVQANLLAATTTNASAINQTFNVATNSRVTLNELFKLLREQLLPNHPHVQQCKPIHRAFRPGDVLHSQADISKAQSLLGYSPTHTLEQGIGIALDWYRAESK